MAPALIGALCASNFIPDEIVESRFPLQTSAPLSLSCDMKTIPLYQEDAYRRDCEATVMEVDQERIILDQTVFYPMGGGQPGDSGELISPDGDPVRIVDTRKDKNSHELISHIPDPATPVMLNPGDRVTARIDWERRYKHMRMHTCLHLLGVALPYGVTGGNITDTRSRLDFDMAEIPSKDETTKKLNELIANNYPVTTRWITDEELDAQPELIRTMSVAPPRGAGRVRLLQVGDIDLQPCGGTHLLQTAEIGKVEISKIEKKGKHNRRVYIVFAET